MQPTESERPVEPTPEAGSRADSAANHTTLRVDTQVLEKLKLERRADSRQGVLGSAVVQGRITEILDLPVLVESALLRNRPSPEFAGAPS